MAKYVYPTGEEQVARHLGGVVLTAEEKERLRQSLKPVAITDKERSFYSCCRQYGPPCQAKHREYGTCPHCGTKVYNILRRWIKKDERVEQFHYLYKKSQADKDTIIAIGVWVAEIWEEAKLVAPEEVRTRVFPYSLLVIPYGGRPVRYINEWAYGGNREWVRRNKPEGNTKIAWLNSTSSIDTRVHEEQLARAIKGTRFAKMVDWAKNDKGVYTKANRIALLIGIAKHPQLEYLVARGLESLARSTINTDGLGAINWRAKAQDKMLPLTRDELGRIKAKGLQVEEKDLLLLKAARELGQRVKLEDAMAVMQPLSGYAAREMAGLWREHGGRLGVAKMARYVAEKIGGHNVGLWRDFLRELRELGELDEARAFPRDLYNAHAETSRRVQIKTEAAKQEELDGRLRELREKYTFHACGLVLEPFGTLAEVIAEGSKQSICIGSYAERYAKGGTVLCKLRQESDPGTPWHAVEFTTHGKMVQCRGERNTTAPEDEQTIRDFWAAWDAAHQTTTAVDITIRARRQAA